MKILEKKFGTGIWQLAAILIVWSVAAVLISVGYLSWDSDVSIATFVGIPAAIVVVGQLFISSKVSRAAYIKDYALKFRSEPQLTEVFHNIVYRHGNEIYGIYKKEKKSENEEKALKQWYQNCPMGFELFDPNSLEGLPQERHLDNLLGFFDTLGYDLKRGMVDIKDVSGMFGFHLDHLIQRDLVQDYLRNIQKEWPNLESFHEAYASPTPFRYLKALLKEYVAFRKRISTSLEDIENA